MSDRRLYIVLLLALAGSALGQTHYSMTRGGRPAGSAVLDFKLIGDGRKFDDVYVEFRGPAPQSVHDLTTYDKDGFLVHETRIVKRLGRATTFTTDVTFDSKGAHVSVKVGDKTGERFIPYPDGKRPVKPDEFWFLRDHPRKGSSFTCNVLDMNRGKWRSTTITYVGDETIEFGGRKIVSHKIRQAFTRNTQTYWLDDKGIPFRITSGPVVFVRAADSAAPMPAKRRPKVSQHRSRQIPGRARENRG